MKLWRIRAWNPNTGKEAPEFQAELPQQNWMNALKREIGRRYPGMQWLEAHRL